MPILIDGNNLLFAARAVSNSPIFLGRSALCQALGAWQQRTGERLQIVFDGPAPPPGLASQIAPKGLEIRYSGSRSADDELVEALQGDSAPRRLLVVTSDHEIQRAARRREARVVESEEFWESVERLLASPPPMPGEPDFKRHGLPSDQTQKWLDEFGLK